jgi:hypothetical protein
MGFGCVITDKTILFFGQKVRTIVWYCNHVLLKTKLVIERQDHIIFWSKSAHHSMVLQPCIIENKTGNRKTRPYYFLVKKCAP